MVLINTVYLMPITFPKCITNTAGFLTYIESLFFFCNLFSYGAAEIFSSPGHGSVPSLLSLPADGKKW